MLEEYDAYESFQYLPLDRSVESTFRLLTLLPGPKGSQPRCTLSVNTWQGGHHSYEALSYVWGESEARRRIILNGKIFEVTENLFSALSHLRFEDRPRVLWVDAICIDQDSIMERSHQVASMGEIYRNCQKVVIWLGDEDNQTEYVIDFIKSTFEEVEQRVTVRRQYRDCADLTRLHDSRLESHIVEKLFRPELIAGWRRFERVLRRPWWTRAWIVQEFANAPDATFHIGEFSIDWTLISALIIVFFGAGPIRVSGVLPGISTKIINAANSLVFTRLVRQYDISTENSSFSKLSLSQIGYSFMVLLRLQSSRECSDPRDKIYSILSMTDASISATLPPDYSKSARWAHVAAVRTYINISKKLDILGCNTEETAENYPSWCPDLNTKRLSQILPADPDNAIYSTSGTTEAVATFSKGESTIYLNGFQICTVVDNGFQDSQKPFIYREYVGVKSNWDIKLMAQKLQHVKCSYGTSPSKDVAESSAYQPEQGNYFNIVTTALLAGFWCQYMPIPPAKKDIETGEWWPEGKKAEFLFEAGQRTLHRTVILCDDGKLGLAPEKTKNGDEIWIFMGASTPFVLRKLNEMDGHKKVYRFIGTAYVHGVMKGESMEYLEKNKYEVQNVALR